MLVLSRQPRIKVTVEEAGEAGGDDDAVAARRILDVMESNIRKSLPTCSPKVSKLRLAPTYNCRFLVHIFPLILDSFRNAPRQAFRCRQSNIRIRLMPELP
jgi:hypothetical protein